MSREIADARRALEHRVSAHAAALRAAEALGWPTILGDAIAETRARLDEARACLAAVTEATAPPPEHYVSPMAMRCPECGAEPEGPCIGVPEFCVHVGRYRAALQERIAEDA